MKSFSDDVISADNNEADLLTDEALLKSLPPSRFNSAGNQPYSVVLQSDDVTSGADAELLKSLPPSPFSSVERQPDVAIDSIDDIVTSHVTTGVNHNMENNGDGQHGLISSSDKQVSDQDLFTMFL